MQWNHKVIVIILRPSTNKVFELEYINQTSKKAKTSHSYLIHVCHEILKDFFDLKVKFWITTCQNFEFLEGN